MISRLVRNLAAVFVALLIPPWLTALGGGADYNLTGGWRVSWYEAVGPALALAGACLALLLPHRAALWQRAVLLLGMLQLGIAAFTCYGVSLETPWFSATTPERPAAIGLALVALGALPLGPSVAATPAWRTAPVAFALGIIGLVLAPGLDARTLSAHIATPPRPPAAPGARSLILVVVDTLRADALGSHGATPSPSPFLDELAAGAVVLERAVAQAPWTFASMATLMTARHPSTLDPAGRGWRKADPSALPRIDDRVPRLATALREAGYHTAAFQKNGFLDAGSGFEVGFDFYEMVGGEHAEGEAAAQTTGAVLRWADVVAGRPEPFFLYAHYMDPHVDYRPPEGFLSEEARAYRGPMDGSAPAVRKVAEQGLAADDPQVAQMRRLYRDEVGYLDGQLARLFAGLEARGMLGEETLVVFTADHGEQFGEHGRFEHSDVHRENVHVPLFVAGVGLTPRRVSAVVGLIDLAPTVLSLLGLPGLEGAEGRSLVPLLAGDEFAPAPAFTEFGNRQRVTTEALSLVVYDRRVKLYAAADPAEQQDLAGNEREAVDALQRLLEAHRAREIGVDAGGVTESRPIDDATRAALEALGYL